MTSQSNNRYTICAMIWWENQQFVKFQPSIIYLEKRTLKFQGINRVLKIQLNGTSRETLMIRC